MGGGGEGALGGCLVPFRCCRPWQQRELSVYLTVKACEKRRRKKRKRKRNRERERKSERREKKQEKPTAGKVEV